MTSSFCALLNASISNLGQPARGSWEISEESEDACQIKSDRFQLTIALDRGVVSSSIMDLTASNEFRDDFQSHVIVRMFGEAESDRSGSIQDQVNIEMNNLKTIMRWIVDNNISPEALYYFYTGYNCAYTDYVTGNYNMSH